MKPLGKLTDRLLKRFVPEASARAVCVYVYYKCTIDGYYLKCEKDRCDNTQYCTWTGYFC